MHVENNYDKIDHQLLIKLNRYTLMYIRNMKPNTYY